MQGKVVIRTLKLKLFVADEDKNKTWQRLYQLSNDSWKAANWIAGGQFLNDQLIRRIYARRKIDPKDNLPAVEAIEAEFKKFFGTKRQATTERDVKKMFPELPSCITNSLNQLVCQNYTAEKKEMLLGNRSLRTYKKEMPMPTAKSAVEFYVVENKNGGGNKHFLKWKIGRSEHLHFGIIYGRDRGGYRATIQQILAGELESAACQFQIKNKTCFLLLPVKDPQVDLGLDTKLSAGVNLGLRCPAYIALSKGSAHKSIGHMDDFLKVRTQMQERRRRLQQRVKSVRGGKGRKKKLATLGSLQKKEKNFARTYNHFISKEIVSFAIKNNAGCLKLEMLEGFGEGAQSHLKAFVLRNWSYFELQTFVEYKAKRIGIKVVKIDPYRNSQTCSACGNYTEDQRSGPRFECRKCNAKIDADQNAAVNVARSDKIVTKKQDCQVYKDAKKRKSSG